MVKEQIVGVGEQMVWGQACSAAVRHPLLLMLAAAAAVCAHISALLAALCVSSFDAQPKLTPHCTSVNFTQTCLSLRLPICTEAGGSGGVHCWPWLTSSFWWPSCTLQSWPTWSCVDLVGHPLCLGQHSLWSEHCEQQL